MTTTDTSGDPPASMPDEHSSSRQWRWLGMTGLLIAVAGSAIIFGSDAPWLLLVLLGIIVGAVLYDADFAPRRLPQTIRQQWQHYNQRLNAIQQQESARRVYAALFGMTSLLFMLLAAQSFTHKQSYEWVDDGVIWMLGGAIMLGIVAVIVPRVRRLLPHDVSLSPAAPNVLLTGVGVLLLLLVAEFSGNLSDLALVDGVSTGIQFVLWLAGLVCLGIGLSNSTPQSEALQRWLQSHRVETGILLLILVGALVLRVVALESTLRASVDEALAAQAVVNYWWDTDAGIAAAPSSYISSFVYPYLQALIADLTEPSVSNLRLLSAIIGTVNVLGVYLLSRELFDKRVALIAALVLATLPPHLHFSRLGLSHIADATVGTFLLFWLTRALHHNKRPDWVLAGLMLGLSQYFFEAGRLFFPLFVGGWLVWVMVVHRQAIRARWRGILTMVIAAVMVALPVYYAIYAAGGENTARLNVSGAGGEYWSSLFADGFTQDAVAEFLWRFSLPFHGYIRLPSGALFYGGNEPMILSLFAPFFLLGFFWMVWRRRSLTLMVPLWIVLVPLSNGLLREVLVFARFVVVLPALAITVAVGIGRVMPLLIPFSTKRTLGQRGIVILLAGSMAFVHGAYYFNAHAPTLVAQIRTREGAPDAMDAVLRANALPPDTMVYAISDPLADIHVMRSWMIYLRNNRTDIQIDIAPPDAVTTDFLINLPDKRYYAFLLAPGDDDTRDFLAAYYDLGEPQRSPADIAPHDQFDLYLVDTDDE